MLQVESDSWQAKWADWQWHGFAAHTISQGVLSRMLCSWTSGHAPIARKLGESEETLTSECPTQQISYLNNSTVSVMPGATPSRNYLWVMPGVTPHTKTDDNKLNWLNVLSALTDRSLTVMDRLLCTPPVNWPWKNIVWFFWIGLNLFKSFVNFE